MGRSTALVVGLALSPACSCQDPQNPGGNGGGGGMGGEGGMGGGGSDAMLNPCGAHDPSCTVTCTGPDCVPPSVFPLPTDSPPDPNVGADGVNRDPNTGYIVLDSSKASFDFLWIANDLNYGWGTVSKISTRPRATPYPNGQRYGEVARYASVTCNSNPTGDKQGAVFGQTAPANRCADGENGCCSRSESTPGANGKHQPVNLEFNRPSRTAVDFNGDVWVANRAFGRQGSVTKIANSLADCVDRNQNGKIDTSSDVNQDGIINTDCNGDNVPDDLSTTCSPGVAKEFFGYDDECILFTTNVGVNDGYARPLALGQGSSAFAASDAWAGTYNDGRFFRIDGTTGLIKQTVTMNAQPRTGGGTVTPRPYGAAVDQFGILWAPNIGGDAGCTPDGCLFYFDTNNPTLQGMVQNPLGGGGFYGIAIDGYEENGQRIQQIWMGAVYAEGYGAYRYRPKRNAGFAGLGQGTWARGLVRGTGEYTQGRGLGVDNRTPTAFVWVAMDGGGIAKIPTNIPDNMTTTLNVATNMFNTGAAGARGSGTLGAGVAVDLDIWGINQGDSTVTHFSVNAAGDVTNAANPDRITLDDKAASPEGFCATGIAYGSGTTCKPHPYTYSDFTGFGLRNFTNPRGLYSYIVQGCGPGRTRFIRVEFDADTPAGTAVTVRARAADDVPSLSQATWTGDYDASPADLFQPPGPLTPNPSGYLQVEFNLTTTDRDKTPALKSYRVVYDCVSGIG